MASVSIISAFQPSAGAAASAVLDLPVRQQGQVLLSVLLSVVGLAALCGGLRRNIAPLRLAGLAMLLLTVANALTVDATSAIDVSARGYMGGYTVGNTTTGGTTGWASGSYGGYGNT